MVTNLAGLGKPRKAAMGRAEHKPDLHSGLSPRQRNWQHQVPLLGVEGWWQECSLGSKEVLDFLSHPQFPLPPTIPLQRILLHTGRSLEGSSQEMVEQSGGSTQHSEDGAMAQKMRDKETICVAVLNVERPHPPCSTPPPSVGS